MALYDIQDVRFVYPSSDNLVLDRVNLQVQEGDVVSLLGRNGAGKSTLMNCMLGLLQASGTILLDGTNIKDLNERQIASLVGYVPQIHVPSFAYTVQEFVVMGCASQVGLFDRPGEAEYEAAMEAMVSLGIQDLATRPYTQISGGQRQQATIARAIVSNPKVVLFDEPTAHLDFTNQLRVLRIIKNISEQGYAVVFTTHNPDHALLLGGKAAVLDSAGKMCVGPVDEILTQDKLQEVFGEDILLAYIDGLGRKVCLYPAL